ISNDGNTPLEWYANIEFPEALIIDIPPSSGDFPMGNYKTSIGMPPEDGVATVQSSAPIIDFMRGATAYGIVAGYEFFCSFDTDEPEVLNNIAAYTGPAFSNAGDFGVGDQSFVYELDNASNLRTIDLDTGVATVIGNPLPTGAETWSGMSTDPTTGTIYASTTDMYNSSLFTIDPETATSTLIGSIGFPSVVGIAVDGNGDMWGYCLVQDEFFSIDKETGLGTLVGSIGFDANYGQGMTWDVETDQLYMSAFNNAPFQAELRIVDRETGNTVMVGVLGATSHEHCQLGWMAIPGFGGPRWITVDPSSGTVAPGGDSLVAVYFDAIDQLPGTILTADIHFFSIPNVGNPIIPVTLTVDDIDVTGEPEILVTGLYDNFPNPFSLFTTIRFSLKEAAHVKLSVYNIRGQLVNRLIDEDMVAGADYQVKWDGTSNDKKLTNGIYFYKFETGNETFLKKTILMK
ncbi:MAG: T9SS type A sorting domain-containing protein, partial [Candidatus Electryonea clarkiae]|nr:T9SS type A sorting domain-containing protein [Candidatus Electryonea clarkiae]